MILSFSTEYEDVEVLLVKEEGTQEDEMQVNKCGLYMYVYGLPVQ